MCFWGKKIEFAVLTLACKSWRLPRGRLALRLLWGGWGGGGVQSQASVSWHRAVDVKTASGAGSESRRELAQENQWAVGGEGQGRGSPEVCSLSHNVQAEVQVLCCRQLMLEPSFCQVTWEEVGGEPGGRME